MQRLKEYLEHADTCRALAAKAKDARRKKELLELADKWTRLAEERQRLLNSRKHLEELSVVVGRETEPMPRPGAACPTK